MRQLILVVFAAGCVGTVDSVGGAGGPDAATGNPHPDPTGPTVDASPGSPDAGSMPITDAMMTTAFTCRNPVAPPANGHHNPGQDCQQGCHNHGFTFSGTLYTSAAGAAIVGGATITAIDAAGQSVDVISQSNGNFYSSTAVTFPLTIYASSCPTIQHMTATVPAGSGGCNKSGCHTAGASPGRVHLP